MVVEIIRYTIPESDAGAFEAAYNTAQAELRQSPHCVAFELSRCVESPASWMLRIEWTSTEAHLRGFRGGPHFASFLSKIRRFVSQIDEMQHYEVTQIRSDVSVFESAGGPEAFDRLAAEMHRRMADDDVLGSRFRRASPTHVPRLAAWLGQIFGGPATYTGADGDIAQMLERHRDLDISETERDRFVACTVRAAESTWPNRPDIVQVIGRYADWGSRVAVENSRPGRVPDSAAGVPSWGWSDVT